MLATPDLDKAAEYAVRWPITAGFFLILLAIVYSTRWVATVGWPKWQEAQKERAALMSIEAEKTRTHLSQVLAQRGGEAESAVKAVQELEAVKQRAIVDGIGMKVDHVSGQVKDVDAKISTLLQAFLKTPAALVLLLVAATAGCVAWSILSARECTKDSDCTSPAYCCSGGTCCRNTASKKAAPVNPLHSSESYRDNQAEYVCRRSAALAKLTHHLWYDTERNACQARDLQAAACAALGRAEKDRALAAVSYRRQRRLVP